jgi:hypothetical protein
MHHYDPDPKDKIVTAILGLLCVGVLLVFWPTKARSQEHELHQGHAEFHDVYKGWQQPNGAGGCCNAKYHPETGEPVGGDCYPTEAWVINGTWYAFRDDGDVIPVPDDRVIRKINPDETGTRGHLCWNYGKVLCFVPPTGAL